jgi:undecaprenyl-diphosphatase
MRRAVAVSAAPALGFVLLLLIHAWAPVARLDAAVSDAFRGYGDARPGWVAALGVATDAAATLPVLVAGLAAVVVLAVWGERRRAAVVAATVLVVWALWSLMHWLLYRPRPEDGFVEVAAYGFPSGHTSNAAVVAVLAVWLLWSRLPTRAARAAVVAGAAGFAGLIGLTRVALLAHWPTDVLGGWLLVLAVFPVLVSALRARAPAPESQPPAG